VLDSLNGKGGCDWPCVRDNQRFQKNPVRPYKGCDNMGHGDVVRGRMDQKFFAQFPRKSLQYISGVWILDNTKLPPVAETRAAAESLFVNMAGAWKGFGDQGFFANFFYDSAAILPECHIKPKAWDHVFHVNINAAIQGKGIENRGVRFKHFYKAATGLDSICHGPAMDDADRFVKNCTGVPTTLTGSWIPEPLPCTGFQHVQHSDMWIFAAATAGCSDSNHGKCHIKMVQLDTNAVWIAAGAHETTPGFVMNRQSVSNAWDNHRIKAPSDTYVVECPQFVERAGPSQATFDSLAQPKAVKGVESAVPTDMSA
jgi:hypothetical protein